MVAAYLFAFLVITNATAISAENMNCDDPQTNEELSYCSQEQLNNSIKTYKVLIGSLNESSVIQNQNIKNKLLKNYDASLKLFQQVCNATSDGKMKDMYYNNCLSTQIDLINKSIQAVICIQQDADGC